MSDTTIISFFSMVLGMMLFSISLLSRNAMSTKWNIAFWSKQKVFLTPLNSEAASQCTLPQIRFSGILQFGRKKGFQDHSRLQLLHLVWIHSLKSSYQWQKKKVIYIFRDHKNWRKSTMTDFKCNLKKKISWRDFVVCIVVLPIVLSFG